jgi:hypothetical protein
MLSMETWELMSYVVTVIGLPLAIFVFLFEQRQFIIFTMLMSLLERAYLLLYADGMSPRQARRWNSWEDYILEWCRRPDFHARLPELLHGEDPSFVRYVERLAASSQG